MKMLKNLSLVLFVSLLLAACGGSSPEAVILKYFESAKSVDFKAAKECLSDSLAQKFDAITKAIDESQIKELKEENATLSIKILRSEIGGENATVYFEETHGDHSHEKSVPLKKENGEWKIAVIY
jgi:hypothetical protein